MRRNTKQLIEFDYTNYRGEVSRRKVIPFSIYFNSTKWHVEEQWLLFGHDIDKDAERTFALKDCDFTTGGLDA